MKKTLAAASLALALIAAPVPANLDPIQSATASAAPAELPRKCWKAKYRAKHQKKCRNYAYWKKMVGEAN